MKKTLLIGALTFLAGCAGTSETQVQTTQTPDVETMAAVAMPSIPCSYPCVQPNGCIRASEPVVLKPRVLEKIPGTYKKRRCCPDEPVLPGQEDQTFVPDAPEIYVISANRTVNSMQKEAAVFFEQIGTIKVYVDTPTGKSDDLPGGIEKAAEVLQKRFANMNTVIVTNDKNEADYVINSVADWYDTPTKTVPAIKFDLFLNEKNGRVVGEWSEIVHQAEGDRSWW